MELLTFRLFQPGDETAFRDLNESWIVQYFAIEPKDIEVLGDPVEHILKSGGEIVMAIGDGRPVGCCALLRMTDGSFELGKMAIDEPHRGHGVGKKLLAYVIGHARKIGAQRLYLETSTKLPNAIHLYEMQGFTHLPPEQVRRSPYTRSDLYMELFLKN